MASVKRTNACEFNTSIDSAVLTLNGVPLKVALMQAFSVKTDQIEGPSWLDTDCFAITAKMPEHATKDQVPAMLQALLAERLKLAAHKEERSRSGYALVVDKGGPKFKEDDPKASFMGKAPQGSTRFGFAGHGQLKGVMTMATLAGSLSRRGYGPVQDLTGLTGKYDIDLSWVTDPAFEPRGPEATASAPAPQTVGGPEPEANLFAALRESLGLKLERRNVSVEFVVIDHIERVPTEN
ncbi:MAG: TIGR03435 family protein [Bryobacteraceae bacterium]